jgi:hypothetical protein
MCPLWRRVTQLVTLNRTSLNHKWLIPVDSRVWHGICWMTCGPMRTGVSKMAAEVIALLFPDPGQSREETSQSVTALVRDAEGPVELRSLVADTNIMRSARLAGRFNCGKPIIDPVTREVIGYEIEPMAVR